VNDTSDIERNVRLGKREEIPNANDDQYLLFLSTTIELSWNQNPDERPTFKDIAQKLARINCLS